MIRQFVAIFNEDLGFNLKILWIVELPIVTKMKVTLILWDHLSCKKFSENNSDRVCLRRISSVKMKSYKILEASMAHKNFNSRLTLPKNSLYCQPTKEKVLFNRKNTLKIINQKEEGGLKLFLLRMKL